MGGGPATVGSSSQNKAFIARRDTSRGSSETFVTGGMVSWAAASVLTPITEMSRPGARPRSPSAWSNGCTVWGAGTISPRRPRSCELSVRSTAIVAPARPASTGVKLGLAVEPTHVGLRRQRARGR